MSNSKQEQLELFLTNKLCQGGIGEILYYPIEGKSGSGKSSILKELEKISSKTYNPFNIVIIFEDEPNFNRFKQYHPLNLIYKEPTKNGLAAELHILNCMIRQINECIEKIKTTGNFAKPTLIVADRGLLTAVVYANLLKNGKLLEEFPHAFLINEIYEKIEKTICNGKLNIIGLSYINASPVVCLSRVKQRARAYEMSDVNGEGGITLKVLTDLDKEYAEHLTAWRAVKGTDFVEVIENIGDVGENAQYLFNTIKSTYKKLYESESDDE